VAAGDGGQFAAGQAYGRVTTTGLMEIREIEGTPPGAEKTAAAQLPSQQAAFIKAALEAGHDEESIARFLEQPPGSAPARPAVKPKKTSNSIIG
jgi:hypothetical protein